jgi:CRISPR/Cas system CMR subunit Cmr4 (Cas7 group RAMP superfamily)
MAREISSRLKISGTLRAETPIHVGGYGVSVDTDLPLARNGKGDLYIPGTSLTGVLRAWCKKRITDKTLIDEIFGIQETDKQRIGTDRDKSHASFVLVEDAKVILPTNLQIEIRDGVGIGRF